MVSVIIPVFNAQSSLKRCLDSVVGQSYRDLEILLVDDGSADGSLEICRSYERADRRVRVLSQKNQGPGAARNRALERANGKYVAFVDADDWIEKDTYREMVEEAEACGADMVICGYRKLWRDGLEDGITGIAPGLYDEKGCGGLAADLIFSPPGRKVPPFLVIRLIRKSVIDAHPSRFDETLRRTEDFLFLVGVHLRCRRIRAITDRCFYQYEQNKNSITHQYMENYWDMVLHIYNTLSSDLRNRPDLLPRLDRMLVFRALLASINEAAGSAVHPVRRVRDIIRTPLLRANLRKTGCTEGAALYGKGFLLMKWQLAGPLYRYARYQTHCVNRKIKSQRKGGWVPSFGRTGG